MKKSVILSLYWGIIVYLLLNLFWGNQGIAALKELEKERMRFEENLNYLLQENRNAQIHLDQLKNDRLSLTILARKLGYVEEGKKIVYSPYAIMGEENLYDLPLLRTAGEQGKRNRASFFRLAALMTGLLVLLLNLIIFWGQKGIRRSYR